MPIANYSTTVSAIRSMGEIDRILVAHGAKGIMTNYNDSGEPTSLSFLIKTQFGDVAFRLPANVDNVLAVLNRQGIRKKVERDMATRVAWRIIKDWVRAQMAILESEMVTIDQIFLPYMTTGVEGKTIYEIMVANKLALPEGRA
mgnify:CR=1 FL=1